MKKIILIPAYEPDSKLINLVDSLKDKYSIVVVNDGSSSELIFNQIKDYAHIISYEENKGKGYALKKGMSYIKENFNKDDILLCVDADGQHSVKDINEIMNILENNKNSFVIGSRVFDKSTPLRSRIGNKLTSRIVYHYLKRKIKDTQTGLRGFYVNLIPELLEIEGNRYEYEMNELFYVIRKDYPIIEKDIETIYFDNNKKSHYKTFKDSYLIYKQIKKH